MSPPQKDLIMPYEDFPLIILYLCPAFVFFSFYYKSLQMFSLGFGVLTLPLEKLSEQRPCGLSCLLFYPPCLAECLTQSRNNICYKLTS